MRRKIYLKDMVSVLNITGISITLSISKIVWQSEFCKDVCVNFRVSSSWKTNCSLICAQQSGIALQQLELLMNIIEEFLKPIKWT